MIDFIISVFEETQVNTWIIICVLILGYLYREGIRNFFSEKLLEKQKMYDEQRDVKQNIPPKKFVFIHYVRHGRRTGHAQYSRAHRVPDAVEQHSQHGCLS